MRIDLSPLMDGRQASLAAEYDYMPDDSGVLLPDSIQLTAPVHVICTITDKNGYMSLTAEAKAQYETPCDRCLEPVKRELSFSIERTVEAAGRGRSPQSHDEDYEDELIVLDGPWLEIDADVTEALSLEIPMVHLCQDDCPGLCMKCGKPLREGPCGCETKKEIDPRMAIFQKLLENP